jgi:hypothetical protein
MFAKAKVNMYRSRMQMLAAAGGFGACERARESGKPKVFQTFAEAQKPLPNHTQISHPQETAHVKIIQRIKTYFTRHFK